MEVETLQTLEYDAAVEGVKCINSFYEFFKMFWPEMSGEKYIDNWHIKYICDQLDHYGMKIARGEEIRKTIVINVPPGSSKSTMATVAFPIWMWLHKPSCTTTNISFSASLSGEHQALSKTIVESTKWKLLFSNLLELKYGRDVMITTNNQWKLQNNFGGKRFNTSVGGSITGMHADIIIEDDPLNPEQAFSDVERHKANRFHSKTIATRKKNDNCYLNIIIAQRLHEEDVCGFVLGKNIDLLHICLPGELNSITRTIVSPRECLDYYQEGILNPIRKGRIVLDDLRETMEGDGYTTQVLQMPFNLEEQPIKPSMFDKIADPEGITWDLWIDGAYTEKTENDPTGITIAGFKDNTMYIREAFDVHMTLPAVVDFIKELASTDRFNSMDGRIFIEPKATGYSLAQYIEKDTAFNYVLIGQDGYKDEKNIVTQGKTARHNIIQPKAVSRRIKIVEGKWNDNFLTQICGFPKAAHDEQVDNIGYAVNHYFMLENTFIDVKAINHLNDKIMGHINTMVTSMMDRYRMQVGYEENDAGDICMYDTPKDLHKHRYLVVMMPRTFGDRGGDTSIIVLDRTTLNVVASYRSKDVYPDRAGYRALELAHLYHKAKLVVVVRDDVGKTQTEDTDVANAAIREIRKTYYDNIYFRLTFDQIKKTKEKEYGFILDRSSSRDIFFNLKNILEKRKITDIPKDIHNQLSLIERKPDTGEIGGKRGFDVNLVTAYAAALKVHEEMHDKVTLKKRDR